MVSGRQSRLFIWLPSLLAFVVLCSVQPNGNASVVAGSRYSFNSQNQLVSADAGAITQVYDAFGNRVAKTANGVTTQYLVDDLNPTGLPQVMDELTNGVVTRTYSYGLQRIDEDQMVSGAWSPSFYNYDGGGSVTDLTNFTGNVTDRYEYDAFGNRFTVSGSTPNNYLYRGEQWDPDLGLYYLRARYYNPLSGRFFSADPLASQGQKRYEYANADPVDESDPAGQAAIVEFLLLNFRGDLQVPFPVPNLPTWCEESSGNPMMAYFPGCNEGNGGGNGAGSGGGPHNPPPGHQKTVWVGWRSLLKGEFPKKGPFHIYPLGLWHHTYIEIDTSNSDGTETKQTWGVLGNPPNSGDNQQVRADDLRNSSVGWSGKAKIQSSDSDADKLEFMLNLTTYPGSICPSCTPNYHNYWWRIPPDGHNSNTYTYNMIKNWGKTPPEGPALQYFSPGYHSSPDYAGYPWLSH